VTAFIMLVSDLPKQEALDKLNEALRAVGIVPMGIYVKSSGLPNQPMQGMGGQDRRWQLVTDTVPVKDSGGF